VGTCSAYPYEHEWADRRTYSTGAANRSAICIDYAYRVSTAMAMHYKTILHIKHIYLQYKIQMPFCSWVHNSKCMILPVTVQMRLFGPISRRFQAQSINIKFQKKVPNIVYHAKILLQIFIHLSVSTVEVRAKCYLCLLYTATKYDHCALSCKLYM